MGLNRVKRVLEKTELSHSGFYVCRKLPEDDPEHFPEPDGYLNRGKTPVWLDATVDAWIAAQLERSKHEARARAAAGCKAKRAASGALIGGA